MHESNNIRLSACPSRREALKLGTALAIVPFSANFRRLRK